MEPKPPYFILKMLSCMQGSFMARFYMLITLFFFAIDTMIGQTEEPPPKTIEVLSMRKSVRQLDGDRSIDFFYGDVVLKQDQTYIYCDSATVEGKLVHAWGNVVIRQGDNTAIFSDLLNYDGNTRLAELNNNVVLESGSNRLYTQRMLYDAFRKIATYTQGATLSDGKTLLKSKRGRYLVEQEDVYFMDNVEVSDPDFKLKTDSMRYSTDLKITYFLMPTIIQFDTSRIYTESGFYNIDRKLAYFDKNPQYTSGGKRAKARIIEYDGRDGITKLVEDAWFEDDDTRASADTMIIDDRKDEISLFGNAFYKSKEQEFSGDRLIYNRKTKAVRSTGRSRVLDGNQILESSSLDFDDEKGLGIAAGRVVWQDTKEGISIFAEQLEQNKSNAYVKAYGGRPLLIVTLDNKDLFIAADTLLSFKQAKKMPELTENAELSEKEDLSDEKSESEGNGVQEESEEKKVEIEIPESAGGEQVVDSVRMLVMYGNVHIYREDMRGLCDSLVFNTADSLFTLHGAPYLWSDSTQFNGDTIVLAARGGKLNEMRIMQNAVVVLSDDEHFFDQISGRTLLTTFSEGKAEEVQVSGNAQTVYYVKNEEKEYTGVNVKKAGKMKIWFEENAVKKVRFYSQPEGEFLPMGQTDHTAIRLAGFSWKIEERPEDPALMTALKWINWEALLKAQEDVPIDESEEMEEEAEAEELPVHDKN